MEQQKYYIFNKGRLLLHRVGRDADEYLCVPCEMPSGVACEMVRQFLDTDVVCYMARSHQEVLPEDMSWVDLRESFHVLTDSDYHLAGKASELLYFDECHRYCGLCGSPMEWSSLISKRCTHCGEELWPKLSTAIIVLIHRGEEALLVKAKNFRRDYYGLVAGFLEAGETLEECVHREVMEETGIRIKNLKYFGSQPWPYPSGVMIGYTAEYESGEIKLQEEELCAGAFFSRDNLPELPGKLSLARKLMDDWLEM